LQSPKQYKTKHMRISNKSSGLVRLILILFLPISLLLNSYFFVSSYRSQIVTSVPDGDSLDLFDGRRIRLLGIDAPEKGRCMYQEAKDRLTTLVIRRRVTLHDTVKDDYGRQLANVYIGNQLVNHIMVSEGLSKYTSVTSPQSPVMSEASDHAKSEQLGIFSPSCRSVVPPDPSCVIKGNMRDSQKTYHIPGCKNYDQTIIDLSFGDQWFCTEHDARDAGFEKATGCK
jgi:endonuclease YncB( thermonuclease family)